MDNGFLGYLCIYTYYHHKAFSIISNIIWFFHTVECKHFMDSHLFPTIKLESSLDRSIFFIVDT